MERHCSRRSPISSIGPIRSDSTSISDRGPEKRERGRTHDTRLRPRSLSALLVLLFTAVPVQAQLDGNADEAKVAPYRLPDPLTMADGKRVTSAAEWTARRRPELLALFQRHIYGVTPPAPAALPAVVPDLDRPAPGGPAVPKTGRSAGEGR